MPGNNPKSPPVLVITGPTASGKTALAHAVAKAIRGEIISADSRQIYRHMDIGTSKPSHAMLEEVRYHFIDEKDIEEEYNAGAFASDAVARIQAIHAKGGRVLVAGGSTLYIEGLLHGFSELPEKEPAVRSRLQEELETKGASALYKRLQSIDPEQAATLDPTKTQRLVRSLEIIAVTGKTVSELQRAGSRSRSPVRFIPFCLSPPRNRLYEQIDERTDAMMQAGLLEEIIRLDLRYRKREPGRRFNALETVGYTELFEYLDGKHDLRKAVELIKQHTRNYAKRQLTFFKNRLNVQWIEPPVHLKDFETLVQQLRSLYEA